MQKKEILNSLWAIVTGIVVSMVIVVGTRTEIKQREKTKAETITPTEEAVETTTETGYILKIAEGQIALFRTGSTTPYERLDMPLNLLSAYDLAQLEEGIEVQTLHEAQRLIEDFTS